MKALDGFNSPGAPDAAILYSFKWCDRVWPGIYVIFCVLSRPEPPFEIGVAKGVRTLEYYTTREDSIVRPLFLAPFSFVGIVYISGPDIFV